MKRIINGKKYDTDTAKTIGYGESNLSVTDFEYWCETLYQNRTGEFFLYGEGGPNSKYSVRIDTNTWSGGEAIFPLTEAKARDWAEKYLTADEYESVFGEVDE